METFHAIDCNRCRYFPPILILSKKTGKYFHLAHDLNNVLSAQVGYPDLILMDLPENSPLKEPILRIQESGQKAAAIVQDLLTMARRGVVVADVMNLNQKFF